MKDSDDFAEAELANGWKEVHVDNVVSWPKRPALRCVECHGPVRAHKQADNGMRAHFEHLQRHAGCSRGSNFSGDQSRHPHALT